MRKRFFSIFGVYIEGKGGGWGGGVIIIFGLWGYYSPKPSCAMIGDRGGLEDVERRYHLDLRETAKVSMAESVKSGIKIERASRNW